MSDMVEVVIDSIRVGLMSQQRVVILREVDAERFLAIWIDPYMAEQITFALQEVEVARPMTHDLIKNVLRSLNAQVVRVEVVALKGDVFYGNVVIESNGFNLEIDSRPSDALALAVRANAPILVAREVMDSVGIVPEEELDDEDIKEAKAAGDDAEAEGEEEHLSVFDDFLEKLDTSEDDEGEEEN